MSTHRPDAARDPGPGPDGRAVPAVRVVRGDPTPEELAALVAVLAGATAEAAQAEDQGPRSRPPSLWHDRARLGRQLHRVGPGAWRGSALRG